MTDTNWAIIEQMIEKIMDDCMGENLYYGLKEKLNGKTLAIEFTNSEGSSFYFDGETSKIKLSIVNMESNHLLHEMFHAFQAYQETWSSYVNAGLNLEIEAHYAQYLYLKKLQEFPGSKWSSDYASNPRLISTMLLEQCLTPKGELALDYSEEELDGYLNFACNAFKEDLAYMQFKYDTSRKGLENFQNLKNLTKDCGL